MGTNTFANSSRKKKSDENPKKSNLFSILFFLAKRSKLTKKTNQKNTHKKNCVNQTTDNYLIRIKTYWDFSGFQGAIYQQCHMGLFSRRKHQLVPKASCDDPKPSPSF